MEEGEIPSDVECDASKGNEREEDDLHHVDPMSSSRKRHRHDDAHSHSAHSEDEDHDGDDHPSEEDTPIHHHDHQEKNHSRRPHTSSVSKSSSNRKRHRHGRHSRSRSRSPVSHSMSSSSRHPRRRRSSRSRSRSREGRRDRRHGDDRSSRRRSSGSRRRKYSDARKEEEHRPSSSSFKLSQPEMKPEKKESRDTTTLVHPVVKDNAAVSSTNGASNGTTHAHQIKNDISTLPTTHTPSQATHPTITIQESTSMDPDFDPFEQEDEDALIQARRKRREAILAKYKEDSGPSTPASISSALPDTLPIPTTKITTMAIPLPHTASTASAFDFEDQPQPLDIFLNDSDLQKQQQSQPDGSFQPAKKQSQEEEEEEPDFSAADYNPMQDTLVDDARNNQRKGVLPMKPGNELGDVSGGEYNEMMDSDPRHRVDVVAGHVAYESIKESTHDVIDDDDMFGDSQAEDEDDDDIFADPSTTKKKTSHIRNAAAVVRLSDNPALTDNWDDPEGYYKSMLGERLDDGRYHVFAHLGKGVFSSVVRARDLHDGDKDVAIKVIRNNDTMYRAGLKELSILQKLMETDPTDKKHIVRFLRSFHHKNHLCLVFESLSMNLRQVLSKYGKDVGIHIKAVRVYAQHLFLALSLLKKCDVLHGDIKPDNMLVSENKSTLRLADFGSACDVSENEVTPYLVSRFYRAPEIILGIPYDSAIDVWSVGCTLFELYTGKILFPGKTNNHMLKLMMDLKGKFNHKMLRKGQFTSMHFEESSQYSFLYRDTDKITGREVIRTCQVSSKPIRDVRERILSTTSSTSSLSSEESWLVSQFIDFLEKCLSLNPDKRLNVKEAFLHPFLLGQQQPLTNSNVVSQ